MTPRLQTRLEARVVSRVGEGVDITSGGLRVLEVGLERELELEREQGLGE